MDKKIVSKSNVDAPPSKFAPKKTSREEVEVAIRASLSELKDHAVYISKLVQSLERTLQADVSFSTVEEAKTVIAGMDGCRKHVVKLRDTLKSRARTRLNEI